MLPSYTMKKGSNFLKPLWMNALMLCQLLLVSFPSKSQNQPVSSYTSLAEKIYLQLDNKVYTTDQTIWYKAIVANAADHTPSKLSGVLYVELVDTHGNIVEKKIIKIKQGFGSGFFQLTSNYAYGVYQVRAYTEWNKNFGAAFLFKEYILVAGTERKKETTIFQQVILKEESKNNRHLQVYLDPAVTDSITEKALSMHVMLDEKKDTFTFKRNKNNPYLLEYFIPRNCRMVHLHIESNNHLHYTKTIAIDTGYLDVQFFPESGELVQDLSSLVGIKILGFDGKGRAVKGVIVNNKGIEITSFKTNEMGMGSVLLDRADSNEHLTARVYTPTGNQLLQAIPLPTVVAKGNILSVRKEKTQIRLETRSNYLKEDSIMIRSTCRGVVYYDVKGPLKNGVLAFTLPAGAFPEGIIHFTLMTLSGTPVAERLYFNERPETRLRIAASPEKNTYVQREKTQLTIETRNSGNQPVQAHLSLLVFNKSEQGSTLDLRQNILSYFLLSSDLKGEIEAPGFYFSKDHDRFHDLDALLLTQGWSKYRYTRDTVLFQFQPEAFVTVSGQVKGGLTDKKIIRGADITLMTFEKPPLFATQKTDSLGRFKFLLDDVFGKDLNIVLQSAGKSNKQKNYLITLEKKETPFITFDHSKSLQKPDSMAQAYIEQTVAQKKAEDAYKSATEGLVLEEVIIKGRVLSAQQKLVKDKYGKAETVIDGKAIQDREAKWSYGLYSVLQFHYPDKVRIRRLNNGLLYARHINNMITLVIIDGIPVNHNDYILIPGIPPGEVKSFEIIPFAKNFRSLFCDALPEACGPNAPMTGNVIAIYTYAGKGLGGVAPTVGINKMTVPVFAPAREFYAPKYGTLNPEDNAKPDLRNLIHWHPNLETDTTGKLSLSFYNPDNTGTIQVVVEALSENGEMGYQELYYEIKKRE